MERWLVGRNGTMELGHHHGEASPMQHGCLLISMEHFHCNPAQHFKFPKENVILLYFWINYEGELNGYCYFDVMHPTIKLLLINKEPFLKEMLR